MQQDAASPVVKSTNRTEDRQDKENKTAGQEISDPAPRIQDIPADIRPAKPSEVSYIPGETRREPGKKLNLEESGLVMIETPPEKIELTSEEPPPPKRTRRKIKSTVTQENGELTQIETRE